MNFRLTILGTIFILLSQMAFTQNCIPDQLYADSTAGVYPRPYTDSFPEGGIQLPACLGEPYTFNFTVKLTDTVLIAGNPIVINSIRLRTATPIIGLPTGISYRCEPPSCNIPANSLGCIELFGVPEESNIPGEYPLRILVELITNFGAIPLEFPNAAISPGTYTLTVGDENGPEECITMSTHQIFPKTLPLEVYPNFGQNQAMLYLPGLENSTASVRVTDIMGKTMLNNKVYKSHEKQTYALQFGEYPSGTYFILLMDGTKAYQAKFVKW